MVTEGLIRDIVFQVLASAPEPPPFAIPLEISARHVHLSREHADELFGHGYQLTGLREISQPGQFLCEERVRLIGEKGVLENVAVLGPIRPRTQVELSAADARALGAKAPLRMSGDLSDAGGIVIAARERVVYAGESVILARNHIHMTPGDAAHCGLRDGSRVRVQVSGDRPVIFDAVTVRVTDAARLAMHIDVDEGNACLCRPDSVALLLPDKPGSRRHNAGSDGADKGGCTGTGSVPPPVPGAAPPRRGRMVVDAEAALALCRKGGDVVIPADAIITPLARDVFSSGKVALLRERPGKGVPA